MELSAFPTWFDGLSICWQELFQLIVLIAVLIFGLQSFSGISFDE